MDLRPRAAPLGRPSARRAPPPRWAPPRAALGGDPAYNKYRSRQDIERAYHRDWERTTLLAEGERGRAMTALSFLAFLPAWAKFYALPGPVRFAAWLLGQRLAAAAAALRRRAVIAGARLDAALGRGRGAPPRALLMWRLHGRVPPLENLRFRWALLRGQVYAVRPRPAPVDSWTPGPEAAPLDPSYDPTLDPYVAS
jgi:hypothetical protein